MQESPYFVAAVRYHAGAAASSEIVSTYMMYIFDVFFAKGLYLVNTFGPILTVYVFSYIIERLIRFLFFTALALGYKVGSVPAWIMAKLKGRKSPIALTSKAGTSRLKSRSKSASSRARTSGLKSQRRPASSKASRTSRLKSRSRSAGRQPAVSRIRSQVRRKSSTSYKVTPKGQQAVNRVTTKLLTQYEKDTKRRPL